MCSLGLSCVSLCVCLMELHFRRTIWFMAFLALSVLPGAGAAYAQSKRVALVIGNGAYQHSSALPNAISDAKAIAAALQSIGFAVTAANDLDFEAMRSAIRSFGRLADRAEFAIVYFAGHGLEANGDNWLIPVSAALKHEKDLDYDAISLTSVLNVVRHASRLRMIVLDACRNNPLGDRMGTSTGLTRTVTRGLGRIEPPGDVLVAYSAKHGTVAEDGPDGGNSPFAQGFLQHYTTAGLDIRILMGRVRDHVFEQTRGRQEPFTYGSVGGSVIPLVEGQPDDPRPGTHGAGASAGPTPDELAWIKTAAGNRLEAYRAYLAKFPGGAFKSDAKERVEHLEALAGRWSAMQDSRNRVALELLVVDVENTEFSDAVKQRLADVYLAEQRAWDGAEREKLVRVYEDFLRDWPFGRNAENARDRLRELTEIRAQWDAVKASDDERELGTFVKKHGWSEFGAAATSRLIALRRDRGGVTNDPLKVLSAAELEAALDGAKLVLANSGMTIAFDTKGQPAYRARLGKDFFKRQFKKSFAGEGSFQAEARIDGRRQKIEGLGGLVKSQVDTSATLFLLQLYGNERSAADVDSKDRHYATLQIIEDYFGHVCVMTNWEPILSGKDPEKIVERCKVTR